MQPQPQEPRQAEDQERHRALPRRPDGQRKLPPAAEVPGPRASSAAGAGSARQRPSRARPRCSRARREPAAGLGRPSATRPRPGTDARRRPAARLAGALPRSVCASSDARGDPSVGPASPRRPISRNQPAPCDSVRRRPARRPRRPLPDARDVHVGPSPARGRRRSGPAPRRARPRRRPTAPFCGRRRSRAPGRAGQRVVDVGGDDDLDLASRGSRPAGVDPVEPVQRPAARRDVGPVRVEQPQPRAPAASRPRRRWWRCRRCRARSAGAASRAARTQLARRPRVVAVIGAGRGEQPAARRPSPARPPPCVPQGERPPSTGRRPGRSTRAVRGRSPGRSAAATVPSPPSATGRSTASASGSTRPRRRDRLGRRVGGQGALEGVGGDHDAHGEQHAGLRRSVRRRDRSRAPTSTPSRTCSSPRRSRSGTGSAPSATKEVTPLINDYWDRAEFPFELVPKLAGLGIAGGTIEGYGCPGMSAVAAGLVAAELARADGSVGTFNGVHSFLAMQSIALLGDEEQRERWLPDMARLEKIGAFGLTEPAARLRRRRPGDLRPPRRRRLRAQRPRRSGSATAPSPTTCSSGPAVRTAPSAATSSRRGRPATRRP